MHEACLGRMSSLKDWKEALASGVSVKTLLGIKESTETRSGKSKKRKLQGDATTSADKERASDETFHAKKKASDVTDYQTFEANLKVAGFLREPQQFRWSSFHGDLIENTVSADQKLKPPVPVLPLEELIGPCFIGHSADSAKTKSESSSSEED